MLRMFLCSVVCLVAIVSFEATAKDKNKNKGYHCEVKKNGKTVDDDSIKTRKSCKKKGGKWVKAHDHGHEHSHDGEDHEHDEDED